MIHESQRSITIPVMELHQPIGSFFVGKIKAKDLIEISDFDIRQLTRSGNIDTYLGIQRRLNETRVDEIRKYVNTSDATFPSGVILAVEERSATLEAITCTSASGSVEGFYYLTLSNQPGEIDDEQTILYREIARVIDGQHRIAGLEGYNQFDAFEVSVVIFVGADIADQASIFSTVNLAQTKVNRSLVYDLFEYAQTRSPEKTCHDVVVILDREKGSPFKDRIKRLGTATEGRFDETLSQATFVRALLPYLTNDPVTDRDLARRGRPFSRVIFDDDKMIFRRFFLDEQDEKIVLNVWNYFSAVSDKWVRAWGTVEPGYILNRTTGFLGLMRFLRDAFIEVEGHGRVVESGEFSQIFSRVELKDDDFVKERYLPGTSGQTKLYHDLHEQAGLGRRRLLL
ncbi:DGQHR domain-containing protein [Mesorhizobium opportunistum]|uniref:DGQHR domain-containing protein n=1 Tax=Mesorhizobium opportunistum TaxID=593909 RepID=UPI00333C2FD5